MTFFSVSGATRGRGGKWAIANFIWGFAHWNFTFSELFIYFWIKSRGNKVISWFRNFGDFGDFQWFRWFQVISVISNDFKWFRWFRVISVISNDFKWFQMRVRVRVSLIIGISKKDFRLNEWIFLLPIHITKHFKNQIDHLWECVRIS